MSTWIKWSDRLPGRRESCDALFGGDDKSGGVAWMACGVLRSELLDYGDPDYWRPAETLPAGMWGWEPGDPNRGMTPPNEYVAADEVDDMIEMHYMIYNHDGAVHPAPGCVICEILHAARAALPVAPRR